MRAPLFSAAEYTAALQALLPRGRAWARDPDGALTKTLEGLAPAFHDSNAAANALLVDAFPATVVDLLAEWEAALGLPGPGGMPPTLLGRQNAVVAALTDTGGQSKPYFIALAAKLGFTITITEYSTYSVKDSVITPIAADLWAHVWQVNASASIAISYTPAASIDVVQATPGFGNPILEAVLSLAKPAHTVVVTSYT